MQTDNSNKLFTLAASYVNQTNRNIFLTGKAGTGKTTFLRYIRENTIKNTVTVAPTGVAAINAGGVTMHSFFQLPFGPYLSQTSTTGRTGAESKNSLIGNIRFNENKRKLLQELDLLIIDEVSMVRADMLDAIDEILRHFRMRRSEPFGGVQLLLIGDLYQLPPVVVDTEREILKQMYASPFFFESLALKEAPPLCIELKKIYRQNEEKFINVLNDIRNDRISSQDLEWLNKKYLPDFDPGQEKYITLTSHNHQANSINQKKLEALPGKMHEFKAVVEGDFSDKAFPADEVLRLKEGAQIMFIKNDKGDERRYYNGKIGLVNKISEEGIIISFPDEANTFTLGMEEWQNVRYSFNEQKAEIEEDVNGVFRQYPIRLAWAITIHKSQGLTFEKAIIDAGRSFTGGQVYVALSRLTGMDGMVLNSKILPQSIQCSAEVVAFMQNLASEELLETGLQSEQRNYITAALRKTFLWESLLQEFESHHHSNFGRQLPFKEEAIALSDACVQQVKLQMETASRFAKQLEEICAGQEIDADFLLQRIRLAKEYFEKALKETISRPLKTHLDKVKLQKKAKTYLKELNKLLHLVERKVAELQFAEALARGLTEGKESVELIEQSHRQKKEIAQTKAPEAIHLPKAKKGDSHRLSLDMFKEGQNPEDIALKRGLATGTIKSHLATFIRSGEVSVFDLVKEDKVKVIMDKALELDTQQTSPIKQALGDDFEYDEIRSVINHLNFLNIAVGVKQEEVSG